MSEMPMQVSRLIYVSLQPVETRMRPFTYCTNCTRCYVQVPQCGSFNCWMVVTGETILYLTSYSSLLKKRLRSSPQEMLFSSSHNFWIEPNQTASTILHTRVSKWIPHFNSFYKALSAKSVHRFGDWRMTHNLWSSMTTQGPDPRDPRSQ
jgi:hypothetical protein